MAGLGLGKDQSHSQDSLPTPLRRRGRAASPEVSRPSGAPDLDGSDAPAPAAAVAAGPSRIAAPLPQSPTKTKHGKWLGATAGIILMLAGLVTVLDLVLPSSEEEVAPQSNASTPVTPAYRTLQERVATGLNCPGPRADIVDILAGAPYEFFRRDIIADGTPQSRESQAFFDKLPQLVARVTHLKDDAGKKCAETDLHETVLQLAATGGGWPFALRQRLLAALDAPCEVPCSGSSGLALEQAATSITAAPVASAIALEIDTASTSVGTTSASSGWLHRSMLSLGAASGIPYLRQRADLYKSRPASVVVSSEPIAPRDCFALRGNASVALRVAEASGSAVIRHIVLEQLPHWIAPKLWSLPGHFEVWGEPASVSSNKARPAGADPYSLLLGSFVYVAAAPAPQAFELQKSEPLRGFRISFKKPASHGPENFFCIYRLRAYKSKAPSCTDATSRSPARLAVPMQG